jgi:death-on-curing protein
MKFSYFDTEHAIKVHDYIIQESGGKSGTLNIGLLESVLDHVQNDIYYPDLEHKVCHLFYSINKNHAFSDGNKRSSIVLAAYFLELNGCGHLVNRFMKEMENIAVYVADNLIDKDLLFDIVSALIYKASYPEDLQLRIVNAIM